MRGYLHSSNFRNLTVVKKVRSLLGDAGELHFRILIEHLSQTDSKYIERSQEELSRLSNECGIPLSILKDTLKALVKQNILKPKDVNGKSCYRFPFYERLDKFSDLKPPPKRKTDHKLNDWISEECISVGKIDQQMTSKQCDSIIDEFGEEVVKRCLLRMDNVKPPIHKKRRTVHITLRDYIGYDMKSNMSSITNVDEKQSNSESIVDSSIVVKKVIRK